MTEDEAAVGATHRFHDANYAADWAARFNPAGSKETLFQEMIRLLSAETPPPARVVELGIGPGYFAERMLGALPSASVTGVDYSMPMIGMAGKRLSGFSERVLFRQGDLLIPESALSDLEGADAVVSTWTLHDLGGEEATARVYWAVKKILRSGGLFLNGDFVKPCGTTQNYESGRFPIARHLEILACEGFKSSKCLFEFETELNDAKPWQNYALIEART